MAIWPWKKTEDHLISKEQAIESLRVYAATNGKWIEEPFNFSREYRRITVDGAPEPVKRPIYVISVGSVIPPQLVEVDAIDGSILAWRIFPR